MTGAAAPSPQAPVLVAPKVSEEASARAFALPLCVAIAATALFAMDITRDRRVLCAMIFYPIAAWKTAMFGAAAFGGAAGLAIALGVRSGSSRRRDAPEVRALWFVAAVWLLAESAHIASTIGSGCPAWPFL